MTVHVDHVCRLAAEEDVGWPTLIVVEEDVGRPAPIVTEDDVGRSRRSWSRLARAESVR